MPPTTLTTPTTTPVGTTPITPDIMDGMRPTTVTDGGHIHTQVSTTIHGDGDGVVIPITTTVAIGVDVPRITIGITTTTVTT